MGKGNWFRRERKRAQGESRRKRAAGAARRGAALNRPLLSFEELEDRRVLATFVVINTQDATAAGATIFGSLRWAVEQANANPDADTILFSDNIFNGGAAFIGLNEGQINITQPVSILGPGSGKLTVSADGGSRIFNLDIADRVGNVQIGGMTLSNGNITGTEAGSRGGAIYNREALTLTEVIVQNNSASQGGGGVFVEFGSLTVERSLFQNNRAGGIGGGGILNASGADDSLPNTNISNSTFYNNRATSGATNAGFGGGVLNRNGNLNVTQSTFYGNTAQSEKGEGIASWGNPVAEDEESDPPPETVTTRLSLSIVYRTDGMSDVAVVGETDDDEPMPLLPSFENEGYNLIGALGDQVEAGEGDLAPGTDPRLLPLNDYGGSMPVMLPNNDPENPDFEGISPVIDAGNPDLIPRANEFEQRGRHFVRIFDALGLAEGAIIDIGAAEVQVGRFFVDSLLDETDLQYSGTTDPVTKVINANYTGGNDFSLREALEFSRKNPELDTIEFALSLRNEIDPTLSAAPTILLARTLGSLDIDHEVIIQGPTTFILEIDATGTDITPSINDGQGTHVFTIDDDDVESLLNIEINNLTIMGADQVGPGGAIYSNENLTLRHVTMKENYSTFQGGAVFIQFGNLAVYESTFHNNAVAGDGGAIFANTSGFADVQQQVLIVNSTISGNVAGGFGGGIANSNARVEIRHSTITLNSAASTRGSGVYNFNRSNTLTEVYSSIISGNLNNDIEYAVGGNNVISLGYNLIGRGNASFAFTQTGDRRNILNPMLAPLANTGGFIPTHRPLVGSPIIDAGNPADESGVGEVPATDQRGGVFVRVYDATGMGAGPGIIDIGAYELQPTVLIVDTLSDVNDGNYSEGNFSLREAIAVANENPLPDTIDMTGLRGVINVTGSSLVITDSVFIVGPDWFSLRIFGNSLTAGPMFVINDGDANNDIDVFISGVGIERAAAGAIVSYENLNIDEVFFQANRKATHGAVIYQENGSLNVTGSVFNGNTTNAVNADGGAIYGLNTVITLNDVQVAGNVTLSANSDGGGIALVNSTLNATATTINGNQAPGGTADGGGVYASGSTVNLTDSVVSGNITTGSNSEGGGIAAYNSAVNLVDTVVGLNRTTGSQSAGGGVYLNGGSLSMLRSVITQNTTSGQAAPGGGLTMIGGSASIVESSLQGNSTAASGGHGGGVYNLGGNLTIRSSSVIENFVVHAQSKGGGVYSDTNLAGTQATLILNTTVSGNSAALRGGGVFNADGLLEIRHSTITNNSTPFMNAGNGVASQGTTATSTRVQSSIVAGNVGVTSGTGSDVDSVDGAANSFQSLGYNVIGVGNARTLFNAAGDQSGIVNPLLAPLDDNGGDPSNVFSVFTHALLPGSPAINAGSPTFSPNVFSPPLTTDQRGAGYARVKSGLIDVGAFESDLAPALPADFNGNGTVDGHDFLTWQRNFGKTGAIKADGDANGDGNVNATDLAAWKSGFGSVAAAPAASAALTVSTTASLMSAEESEVDTAIVADSAPAAATSRSATRSGRFDWLASLGRGEGASLRQEFRIADESLLWRDLAATPPRIPSSFLAEESMADLELLLAGEADGDAEDAVFAAWGEGLL
jgi:hypothetical protein